MGISLQFLVRLPLPDLPVIEEPGTRVFYTQPRAPGSQSHHLKLEEKAVQPQTECIEVHWLSQIW